MHSERETAHFLPSQPLPRGSGAAQSLFLTTFSFLGLLPAARWKMLATVWSFACLGACLLPVFLYWQLAKEEFWFRVIANSLAALAAPASWGYLAMLSHPTSPFFRILVEPQSWATASHTPWIFVISSITIVLGAWRLSKVEKFTSFEERVEGDGDWLLAGAQVFSSIPMFLLVAALCVQCEAIAAACRVEYDRMIEAEDNLCSADFKEYTRIALGAFSPAVFALTLAAIVQVVSIWWLRDDFTATEYYFAGATLLAAAVGTLAAINISQRIQKVWPVTYISIQRLLRHANPENQPPEVFIPTEMTVWPGLSDVGGFWGRFARPPDVFGPIPTLPRSREEI